MSLRKCIHTFENKHRSLEVELPVLDPSEVVIKTTNVVKKKKRKPKKSKNSKFYKYLIKLLDEEKHKHMLKYVQNSDKREFEVIFIDKKNKTKWSPKCISLFMDMDRYLGREFKRERAPEKYEEVVKIRFKSNMCKCIESNLIQLINEEKIEKCITVKRYRILWRPLNFDEEPSNDRIIDEKAKVDVFEKRNIKLNDCLKEDFKKNFENVLQKDYPQPEDSPLCFENVSQNVCLENVSQEYNCKTEITGFENVPLNGNHEINVHQENDVNMTYCTYEEENETSYYPCLPLNSQMGLDRNPNMYSKVDLENLKTLDPIMDHNSKNLVVGDCDSQDDLNSLDMDKITEILCENARALENFEESLIEENQNIKNGKYLIDYEDVKPEGMIDLPKDPFFCSGPEFISSQLENTSDWCDTYQILNGKMF